MPQFSWIIGSEKESNPPLSPGQNKTCRTNSEQQWHCSVGEGGEVPHVSTRGALLYETTPHSEEQTAGRSSQLMTCSQHCDMETMISLRMTTN